MAPTGKRVVSSLPPQAQFFAQKVDRLVFTNWRFVEDAALPDPYGGIQVRDESSLAPAENVGVYAENMLNGDLFPPIVMTADGYQIDGRTRNLAKRKITKKGHTPVHDAIVLAENFEGATAATMARFYILGRQLNNHGEKLTKKNVEGIITQVWVEGMSQTDLARQLSVHPNTVKAVVNAKRARERLEALNREAKNPVDVTKLNRTTLSQLETKGRSLYDTPLLEVADVAVKAKMTGSEVGDLLNDLNELHSEGSQMELLAGVRDQRRLQIKGVEKNPLAVQAVRNFDWFIKYADEPGNIAETGSPEAKREYVRKAWAAIAVMRKVTQDIENELGE